MNRHYTHSYTVIQHCILSLPVSKSDRFSLDESIKRWRCQFLHKTTACIVNTINFLGKSSQMATQCKRTEKMSKQKLQSMTPKKPKNPFPLRTHISLSLSLTHTHTHKNLPLSFLYRLPVSRLQWKQRSTNMSELYHLPLSGLQWKHKHVRISLQWQNNTRGGRGGYWRSVVVMVPIRLRTKTRLRPYPSYLLVQVRSRWDRAQDGYIFVQGRHLSKLFPNTIQTWSGGEKNLWKLCCDVLLVVCSPAKVGVQRAPFG